MPDPKDYTVITDFVNYIEKDGTVNQSFKGFNVEKDMEVTAAEFQKIVDKLGGGSDTKRGPDYRTAVMNLWNKTLDEKQSLTAASMGISGEAGEFTDAIKKHLFHGHDLDKEYLIKELGDIRYYLEVAAFFLGTTMHEIEQKNIVKLTKRYPDGFSHEASKNRTE